MMITIWLNHIHDYHLVMTNIANWKIPYNYSKWRFIAGKIICKCCKWANFHSHVFFDQRVS